MSLFRSEGSNVGLLLGLLLLNFLKKTSEHCPDKQWKYKVFQNSSKLLQRLHFFPVKAESVYFLTVKPKFLWHTFARENIVAKSQHTKI